jgi:hypothetical protein
MRKLGLSRLLHLVVVVPILAMVAFCGVLVLETLNAYREIENLSEVEELVSAASHLTITALYRESVASLAFVISGSESQRAAMNAARQRADEVIRTFRETAAAARLSDPEAIGIIREIEERLAGVNELRAKADTRTLQRHDAGDLLQPITAGLADLFPRLALLINQEQLSQSLLAMPGHHGVEQRAKV